MTWYFLAEIKFKDDTLFPNFFLSNTSATPIMVLFMLQIFGIII